MGDVDPRARWVPKELRSALENALSNGWTGRKQKSGGYRMRSPGGTETFYVPHNTVSAQTVAEKFMSAQARAALAEGGPRREAFLEAANDPKDPNLTLTCDECDTEFLTIDGYQAHLEDCIAVTRARLAAEREDEQAITQPGGDMPAQGHTGALTEPPVELHDMRDSTILSNKEEPVGATKKKPSYTWHQVKPGLARALYEAMMSRSRHKDEATSTYANVLAQIIEDKGFQFAPVMNDAEQKLDIILRALDIDPEVLAQAEGMRQENEQLRNDLSTLKDLLNRY